MKSDEFLKARAIELMVRRKSVEWIATNLNIPRATIYSWKAQHKARGFVQIGEVQELLKQLADHPESASPRAHLAMARKLESAVNNLRL